MLREPPLIQSLWIDSQRPQWKFLSSAEHRGHQPRLSWGREQEIFERAALRYIPRSLQPTAHLQGFFPWFILVTDGLWHSTHHPVQCPCHVCLLHQTVRSSRPSSQCWYQAHSRHSINVCWMKEQISGLTHVCLAGLLDKQTGVSPMSKVSVQCCTKFPASGCTRQVVKSELTSQQPCDLMQVAQPCLALGNG